MTAKHLLKELSFSYHLCLGCHGHRLASMPPNSCVHSGPPKGEVDKDHRTLCLRTPQHWHYCYLGLTNFFFVV